MAIVLSVLAVVAGSAYIWVANGGPDWQRYLLKPLTTVLILGVALSVAPPLSDLYRWLIVAGILLSLAGDIFLMLPQNLFVWGLASFLVAHLFYIWAYTSRTGFRVTWWIAALFGVYVALLLYLLWPHVGAVRIPVVIYGLVLATMGWQAAEQWWHLRDLSALLALLGALLFLLSDSALALNKFRAPLPQANLMIMSTYYSAQLLIAWSVARW